MNQGLADADSRVIGTKQTVRALERGCVSAVYIASDAEEHVIRDVKALCVRNGVPIIMVDSMEELGKACGIDVGAASAAILHE
ncbi:MAG: ribosomal L7Ae/L30e/S12e/Gadd45 family protein [Bacillota bacterium]|jgi:large subunit ribosomal protein L7A|nr:50S ribosomal protein L7Ae-like protein [Bacillota bacterium]HOB42361.1 ribosomal L7Ae/L30e/S12e/Gadd45 family protein [Bacillota bacterium]HOO30402.1 ribosomal L7Ae/L30e/S12e/Gadd45 family protein [Bacillota bacterium]HPQ02260.1 ribosomal L7Ae/L30e/S12e/Gadd45 family protein [Bacillota bacterium]HPZ13377.1 ribosomal L7Ae/L30e/S12e/Gadd45 family protein [Bacillota bacterium]